MVEAGDVAPAVESVQEVRKIDYKKLPESILYPFYIRSPLIPGPPLQLLLYPPMKKQSPRPQSQLQSLLLSLYRLPLRHRSQNLSSLWRQPQLSNQSWWLRRRISRRVNITIPVTHPLTNTVLSSRHRGRHFPIRGAHLYDHHPWPTGAHAAPEMDAQGSPNR